MEQAGTSATTHIARWSAEKDPALLLDRLTTAERLVLETVVARAGHDADHTVLPSRLWIKPQLDSLQAEGLVVWRFDEEGDFRIQLGPGLARSSAARPALLPAGTLLIT